jgi:phosphate acetyltransferase
MQAKGRTFDELHVGDHASVQRTLQPRDLRAWDAAFGAAGASDQRERDAAGIVTAILTSLVGTDLPGPGSTVRSCTVDVVGPVPVGAPLTAELSVREKRAAGGMVVIEGRCTDDTGAATATAVLKVAAPSVATMREVPAYRLEGFLDRCRGLKPMLTGVVHPCSEDALAGAVDAAQAGLIVPVLFGPESEIKQVARTANLDVSPYRIVTTTGAEDSAEKAAMAAGSGDVKALMKGSLHTDVMLHAVMQKEAKLRTGRLLSHCAAISVPTYGRMIVLTDAALNMAPDTDQKMDICQNAIGCARALGIDQPKVAVLAAVETVRTRMQATLDGAILAKMADRRQIVGGIVDGPLDLDAAVDPDAARTKRISSPVAGHADVLVAPNIEAGNMIYKDLVFMADAQSAGLVVGARVPMILTSRADTAAARRFSAAAAVLYADALARDPHAIFPETAE